MVSSTSTTNQEFRADFGTGIAKLNRDWKSKIMLQLMHCVSFHECSKQHSSRASKRQDHLYENCRCIGENTVYSFKYQAKLSAEL